METPTADEWFPPLLANYKTYVSHAYEAEKSSADESDFFKNYLQQDLQVRFPQVGNNIVRANLKFSFLDACRAKCVIFQLYCTSIIPTFT